MFKPPISKLYAKGCRTPFDLPERTALPSRGKRPEINSRTDRQRPRQRQIDLPQLPTCTIFAVDKPPHGQTPGKPVPHPARIVFVR